MNVYIHPMSLHKINEWVRLSPVEVSGLGKVVATPDGLYVTEVYMPKQTNSATETEFDDNDMADLHFDTKDVEGTLTYWWHSHVNMAVNWSGTDRDTIKKMASRGLCLASVFNKQGEIRTTFAHNGAPDKGIPAMYVDNIELKIATLNDHLLEKEWREKCTEKKYTPPPMTGHTLYPNSTWSTHGQREFHAGKGGSLLTDSAGTQEGFRNKEDEKKTTVTNSLMDLSEEELKGISDTAKKLQADFNRHFKESYKLKKGMILDELTDVVENYYLTFQFLPEDAEDLLDFYDWLYNLNSGALNARK